MKLSNIFRFRKDEVKKGAEPPLVFYNTLARKKEVFVPINRRYVKMYNCGPTVYDYQHIGNLRSYVFADMLRRTLLYNSYAVRQVINITDVGHLTGDNEGDPDMGEDKMEAGATERGLKAQKLAREVTRVFQKDLGKLNIETSSITFTRATDHIGEQIALVEALEERGYTYRTKDGIYYDTSRFSSYGALGEVDLRTLQEGARVKMNPEKRHPSDFALWKFSPKGSSREQEWDSPWGTGFPGWHLECTAMVFAKLGRQIDIHTGGIDHIPIHHNNEIAQAEAIIKKPYVRYWLHNAFITIEGTKVSKSLGNTLLLRQLEDRGYAPLAFRYWLLTAHYRSPVNFTWEALAGAHRAFSRLLRLFVEEFGRTKGGGIQRDYQERFHRCVNDDLNTPGAIAVLWDLVRDETVSKEDKRATLLNFDKVLGLGLIEGQRKLRALLAGMEKKLAVSDVPDELRALVEERERARGDKDWERADRLRDNIRSKGYDIEDTGSGPEVRRR